MDYKEIYDAALERAKKLQETCDSTAVVGWCEYIFPELQESEDVRIKKTLIAFFRDWERTKSHCWNVNVSAIIAWLEKQGEQKPYGHRKECEDCQFNYAGECKGSCALKRNEHKPTDKVEPKFNVGDWIISNDGTHTYLVKERKRGIYVLLDIGDGVEFNIVIETADRTGRLWSIYDAKDGDVLVASDGSIFLFAGVDDCACKYYVALTTDNYVKINKETKGGYWEASRAVHPATKEQHDLLFQKMADAGYEFVNGHLARF